MEYRRIVNKRRIGSPSSREWLLIRIRGGEKFVEEEEDGGDEKGSKDVKYQNK